MALTWSELSTVRDLMIHSVSSLPSSVTVRSCIQQIGPLAWSSTCANFVSVRSISIFGIWSVVPDIHIHTSCNAVSLVWGSLRLTPIRLAVYPCSQASNGTWMVYCLLSCPSYYVVWNETIEYPVLGPDYISLSRWEQKRWSERQTKGCPAFHCLQYVHLTKCTCLIPRFLYSKRRLLTQHMQEFL